MRNETDGIRPALREAIETARATGVTVHISHLKAAGGTSHHTAPDLLAILERALVEGIDLTAVADPYTAGSTMQICASPNMADRPQHRSRARSALGPWGESRDRSFAHRQRIGMAELGFGGRLGSSDHHLGTASPRTRGEDPLPCSESPAIGFSADTIARILLDEGGSVMAVIEVMVENDVQAVIAWPHDDRLGVPLPRTTHPRLTGAFSRILSRYRASALEATVVRMTGVPAQRFRLTDRASFRDGAIADLVLFDPAEINVRSTYADP